MGLSALAIAAGVAMSIWVDPRIGIGLVIGGSVMTAISYFMMKYLAVLVLFIGVIFVLAFGYLIWHIVINRKALIDSVITVEELKGASWDKAKDRVKRIQSPKSRKIIDELKHKERI